MATVALLWPMEQRSGPYPADEDVGPNRLWKWFRNPRWPHTILVGEDGTVTQVHHPDLDAVNAAKWVLYGGANVTVEEGSELYGYLAAAGFEFTEIPS